MKKKSFIQLFNPNYQKYGFLCKKITMTTKNILFFVKKL